MGDESRPSRTTVMVASSSAKSRVNEREHARQGIEHEFASGFPLAFGAGERQTRGAVVRR